MSCENNGSIFINYIMDEYNNKKSVIDDIIDYSIKNNDYKTKLNFLASGNMGNVYLIKDYPYILKQTIRQEVGDIESKIGFEINKKSRKNNYNHLPVLLDYKVINNKGLLISPLALGGMNEFFNKIIEILSKGTNYSNIDKSYNNFLKYIICSFYIQAILGILVYHLSTDKAHSDIKVENFLVFNNKYCNGETVCINSEEFIIKYPSFKIKYEKIGKKKFIEGKGFVEPKDLIIMDIKNMYVTIADFGAVTSKNFWKDYYDLFKRGTIIFERYFNNKKIIQILNENKLSTTKKIAIELLKELIQEINSINIEEGSILKLNKPNCNFNIKFGIKQKRRSRRRKRKSRRRKRKSRSRRRKRKSRSRR